jgi:type IV secretory pathway TraG/TraD family ATPase VirD4
LATKESFWVFSGDDVKLKISDRKNPTIIVLASDPNTQDINSALYSTILNRLLKQINSKGNLPSGIIADELPTIYIHKIDNLIATARSNKVAVLLGLQEIPQFRQFYKKELQTRLQQSSEIFSVAVLEIKVHWIGLKKYLAK